MVALPFLIVSGFQVTQGWGLILIYLVLVTDPLSRSIVYPIRWIKGKDKNIYILLNKKGIIN